MTRGSFNEKVLAGKARFVREAVRGIASLPLGSELYRVLTHPAGDLEDLLDGLLGWVEKEGPVDRSL